MQSLVIYRTPVDLNLLLSPCAKVNLTKRKALDYLFNYLFDTDITGVGGLSVSYSLCLSLVQSWYSLVNV